MPDGRDIHQIEYRWHDRRDLSPVASTMSPESLRGWDSWIRAWVRHPHADRLWESVCYQVQPAGRAALAWRYEDWQAAEREDGTRGRPLVSRVLVGMEDLLTPELAIVLCRTGLPDSAGPRPGQVTGGNELPVVSAAELGALVRERAAGLDKEAAEQEGLQQVVTAALAKPATPLAIQIRDPHILKAPDESLQCRLLWGLWRIVWPVLGTTGRGWSFSTFEPPQGDVDPATLPDILFRQAQDAPVAAPARPRPEVKVRLMDPAAPEYASLYTEMAGWLVHEYRELGGDELKRLIAGWSSGEHSREPQLFRVYDELCARQSPIVMSDPTPYVHLSPAAAPEREPPSGPAEPVRAEYAGTLSAELVGVGSAESMEFPPTEPIRALPAEPAESAPAEGRPPGGEAIASQQMLPPVAEGGGLVQAGPTAAGDQAFAEQQTTAPPEAFGEAATASYAQAGEQQTEAPQAGTGGAYRATGPKLAGQAEQDRYSVRGQRGEQGWRPPGPARDTGAGSYPGTSQNPGTVYYGNDPSDPHAREYSAGSGDTAVPHHRGDIPHSGTSSWPPQQDVSAEQPTQHPPAPEPPPVWSPQADDPLGLFREEGTAPPREHGRDQQAPAGWPEQPSPPALQEAAVDDLLRMLPMAANDQEFWSILREILSPGVPSETDRRRARREIGKPEWYVQMEQSGRVLDANKLSQLFQKIVIPDLGDPLIVKMIGDWAADKPPVVVGGLLAAASESGDDIWQAVMQILQPRLAYRWMAENGIEGLWNPSMQPPPGSEPGRGRRGRRRRN